MKQEVYQQLRLAHLEAALPQMLQAAQREQWTYETFLQRVLAAEVEGREQKAIARRLKAARIPSKKTLDGFDFSFQPSLSERRVRELADLSGVAHLHQYCVSWPARNRKNAPEPSAGRASADCWLLRALHHALGVGLCALHRLSSRSGEKSAAPLYCSESVGNRRGGLHQVLAGAGSALL